MKNEFSFFSAGSIPDWLSGSLYRVGPGIIQVGDSCYNHPFDMLSVVHRYTVSPDGQCTYRNKVVDSKTREYACNGAAARLTKANSTATASSTAEADLVKVTTASGSPDPFKTKLQR